MRSLCEETYQNCLSPGKTQPFLVSYRDKIEIGNSDEKHVHLLTFQKERNKVAFKTVMMHMLIFILVILNKTNVDFPMANDNIS